MIIGNEAFQHIYKHTVLILHCNEIIKGTHEYSDKHSVREMFVCKDDYRREELHVIEFSGKMEDWNGFLRSS